MDMSVGSTTGEEAADFFAQTLEQANDAVVIIDDRNQVVFFNAAAERFWGCQRHEVLGSEVGTLVPIPIRSRNDGETGVNKIIGTSRDVCITRQDGEERWGAMAISKITLQGRILYAAFFKDVTQTRLKDIEQRLLSMSVNASSSATCIVDADGRLIYINDGLVRLLGYSREELLERSPQIFFVADTPGRPRPTSCTWRASSVASPMKPVAWSASATASGCGCMSARRRCSTPRGGSATSS